MNQQQATSSLFSPNGARVVLALRAMSTPLLGLAAILLALLIAGPAVFTDEQIVAREIEAGLEASTARLQAQGEAYLAARAEKAAKASSERYAALASYYGAGDAFLANNPEMMMVRCIQAQRAAGDEIPQLLCCVDAGTQQ